MGVECKVFVLPVPLHAAFPLPHHPLTQYNPNQPRNVHATWRCERYLEFFGSWALDLSTCGVKCSIIFGRPICIHIFLTKYIYIFSFSWFLTDRLPNCIVSKESKSKWLYGTAGDVEYCWCRMHLLLLLCCFSLDFSDLILCPLYVLYGLVHNNNNKIDNDNNNKQQQQRQLPAAKEPKFWAH